MNTVQIVILVSMLLLMVLYEGARTAFLYSFSYREKECTNDVLSEKIICNFYQIPGSFLLATRLVATLSMLVAVGVEFSALMSLSLFAWKWANVALAVGGMVLTYLLFGFFLPKYLFGRNPDRSLKLCAFPIYLIGVVLIPLTRLLVALPKWLLKLSGINLDEQLLAKLLGGSELVESHAQPVYPVTEPDIKDTDLKIFRNALEFSNVRVRDCIVPRTEIVAVEINDAIDELIQLFVKSGKTKIIVYQEDLDHILGYVHSSDMFSETVRGEWTRHIRQSPIVPESMSAQKMMQIFMQQKKSIAVVVDEFGGTSGIISLEDLVEEIFGEIEDEHDNVIYTARKLANNEYLLSARLEIEKVNEQFSLHIPEASDYLTVGGFILFHYQDFPKVGQTVSIGRFVFTILKTSAAKIELVKLKVLENVEK